MARLSFKGLATRKFTHVPMSVWAAHSELSWGFFFLLFWVQGAREGEVDVGGMGSEYEQGALYDISNNQ